MKKHIVLSIFLATFVVAVFAGKEDEECIDELQLKKDEIDIINQLRILPDDDISFTNYLECIYKKKGVITDDGFDWNKFAQPFLEDIIEIHKPFPGVRKDRLKIAVDALVDTCKAKTAAELPQMKKVIQIKNCLDVELGESYRRNHPRKF